MESQDGISVRPMRLKVLYTFDESNKTNCLARWPNLLDIQTAALDEKTHVGVIELKTCIQAIVSASPELVAQLGQDYTVYAYDYSEYETPLVGQGMLSWVLASGSSTPMAPAHQSKTMVTGRVCKNVLGLFSKGAQETLEVKLRLVPVPTVMQSEYLDSMQRYRELSNIIPHEFDAQSWTNFLRQNPGLMEPAPQHPDRTTSPMNHSGIERFHQLLSEGSTPREFPSIAGHGSYRSVSPASRVSTPGQVAPQPQVQEQIVQQRPQPQRELPDRAQDLIRPSSSVSMRESDPAPKVHPANRRDSIQSGYGSCDESADQQPRKRAKLLRTELPGKKDFNIERQPTSLRVAASTAASVRIHRPTPVNPSIAAAQSSNEEPVRPPTPISNSQDIPRRERPRPSLLRVSSLPTNPASQPYTSPYPPSDDLHGIGESAHSPEESRYQGLFEPSFSMPSSPPVLDCGLPNRSSPVLPPMATDPDSGFMSGGLDDLLDEEIGTPLDCSGSFTNQPARNRRIAPAAVHASSPVSVSANRELEPQSDNILPSDILPDQPAKDAAPARPRAPGSSAGSRPSSRASFRPTPKPIAPAPISQNELEHLMGLIPASDPVTMSDNVGAETPAPQPTLDDDKGRSGAGARRKQYIQPRLDACFQAGCGPPHCENCGAKDTPTWRRAWHKDLPITEDDTREMAKDENMLFWQPLERNDENTVQKFKVFKKKLAHEDDSEWVQMLLCNPCGLWLQKFRTMRPEQRWKASVNTKKKRPVRNRREGPLSNGRAGTLKRSKTDTSKVDGSSPVASDGSSPPAEDDATPRSKGSHKSSQKKRKNDKEHEIEIEDDDKTQEPPSKRRRANSVEPRRSSDNSSNRWEEQDAMEALRRAIQSSPARNMENRNPEAAGESLTPKPVRRALFPNSHNEGGPLKVLGDSITNSPRRTPRGATRDSEKGTGGKENNTSDLDYLFESSSFDFDLPTSPTPKRHNPRMSEKRLSLPCNSPSARRKVGNAETPTKATAQRLQRVQSSPNTPRQRTPRHSRTQDFPELPSLPDDVFGSEAFHGMDNVMVDIFSEDATSADQSDLFGFDTSKPTDNWPGWLSSDYVSPHGSEAPGTDEDPEDFINAILSNPADKDGLSDPQFDNIFDLSDSTLLDSGFFSSDALNTDSMALTAAKKPSEEPTKNQEQQKQNADTA